MSTLIVTVVLLLTTAWLYRKWRLRYWQSRGIPTPSNMTFKWGKTALFEIIDQVYTQHSDSKFVGTYEGLRPTLIIRDPDLLKHIFVKDFDHFVDRRMFPASKKSVLTQMLGSLSGEEWKELRNIMTPTFSSGKIKNMFHLVCEKADTLVELSIKEAKEKEVVDIKTLSNRFTMATIASCAFGIECTSLITEGDPFFQAGNNFFSYTPFKFGTFLLAVSFPVLISLGLLDKNKSEDFFREIVEETLAVRLKGRQKRGDFLDLLIEARKDNNYSSSSNPEKKALTDERLIAQCIVFLIAGFETVGNTITFALFLLAKHKEHQARLRKELQELESEHGGITYQSIMEAKFLEACIQETLRMYPNGFATDRKCTKEYTLPGTDLTLYPGQYVTIPIYSLQHDPKYWPEPEEFRPDRFMPENRANIKSFTHLPFGMGPRNCIAMRFALMEAKVALAKMVLAVELEVAPGHEDVAFECFSIVLKPKDGSMKLLLNTLNEE